MQFSKTAAELAADLSTLRDGAADDRPRERLHSLGSAVLSDAELLALVLRTGGKGADALELSRGLLGRCGGLRGLADAGRASGTMSDRASEQGRPK